MDFETAFKILDAAVVTQTKRHLKDIELAILRSSWQGKKYDEIAQTYGYTTEYLQHDVGPKLWQMLSEVIGEKVSKKNFQAALERQRLSRSAASPKHLEAILQSQKLMSSSQLNMEKMTDNNSVYQGNREELLTVHTKEQPQLKAEAEFPVGQVRLASSFYVERPRIEERRYQNQKNQESLRRKRLKAAFIPCLSLARLPFSQRERLTPAVGCPKGCREKYGVCGSVRLFLKGFQPAFLIKTCCSCNTFAKIRAYKNFGKICFSL